MGRKAIGHLFVLLFFALTVLCCIVTFWCGSAARSMPVETSVSALAGLLLPVMIGVDLLLLVVWLVRRNWIAAIVPLVALAGSAGYLRAMVGLRFGAKPEGDLRVATINIHNFNQYGNAPYAAHLVTHAAMEEQVDVLCMQEFELDSQLDSTTLSSYFHHSLSYIVYEGSQAILSRYPILDYRYSRFPDTNNDWMMADLLVGGDTVRVISVHLQTSGLSLLSGYYRRSIWRLPIEAVKRTLTNNSRRRAEQVESVLRMVDTTRHRLFLAGDFNDLPASYTYHRLTNRLHDGFCEAGRGIGGTFRPMGKLLRIDYLLHDDASRCVDYRTLDGEMSDHKMVVAAYRFEPTRKTGRP